MKVAEVRDELISVYGHKSDEINNIKKAELIEMLTEEACN